MSDYVKNPYDLYDGEDDLPFYDDRKWEDGDRAYDEMVDEQVLEGIYEQRCAELTRKVQNLAKEIKRLDNENAALRKMLSAAALVGKQGW